MRALSIHPKTLFSQYRGVLAYNMADDDAAAQAAAAEKAANDAKAKEEADAKAKADAEAAKGKGDETEGRISELAKANKELKAQIKAREDADKKAEEEKLLKKGEHEKLLEQRSTELATEKKAREDFEAKVKNYEDHAKKQIAESLKTISDAEKKKSAEAMLAGRSIEDQIALLPEVMKLAGGTANSFGGGTPQGKQPGGAETKETLESELNELITKIENGKPLSPEESKRQREIERKLQELKFPTTK